MSKLKEMPSALKREHPALKKLDLLTCFYVCGSFLPSRIRIQTANPDPDRNPGDQLNPYPDPQHW